MKDTTLPLDRFPLCRTQNAEEMCAALASVYAKPSIFLDAGTKVVDVAVNHYQASATAMAYTNHGTAMTAVYPENDFALQSFPIKGRGEIRNNKTRSLLSPRRGVIASPGMEFAIKLNADYEHFVLVMNAPALADKLGALSGAAIKYPLSFDPVPDDRTPAAKALREHFFFLVDQLSTSAASLPKFVLTEFEQTLMVMFLHASRHNYSHLMEQSALGAAPWQVRRAEEYIEASWQQAITLEDV
jgi:hypothetical protein